MFSIVAVVSINIMNSGLSSAQASLEITMARNEIDAQAEALRFIHDSYVTQRKLDKKTDNMKFYGKKTSLIYTLMIQPTSLTSPHFPVPTSITQ